MATVIDAIAPERSRRTPVRITATTTGIVAALLAVLAGSLFDVRPPDVYGLCMACHARDLVNWIVNATAGTRLTVAPVSLVFPVLTPIGVVLGAMVAARVNSEFRLQTPDHPLKTFVYGIVVMNCALLAGGCSIRLLLRTAAGETLGIIGFGALASGVILATVWLRWRAAR